MALLKNKIGKNRAKKNFKRFARKFVKKTKPKPPARKLVPRSNGDKTDFLKVTVARELYKRDFTTAPDQSMYHDIMFNVTQNLSTTASNGTSNLFYAPQTRTLFDLFAQYKCVCIVVKMSRPNQPISYNNTNFNSTGMNIQLPTIPMATKVMHTRLTYQPDSDPTDGVDSNVTVQPRICTDHPVSWRETVDDGARVKTHQYKRYVTRVWKPVNAYERRWTSTVNDNTELVRGGLHIRFQKDHPVDLYNTSVNSNNFNTSSLVKLLDLEATIYMQYKDRH